MIFKDVSPTVIENVFRLATQVEFAKRELENGREVRAKFKNPFAGEVVAKIERFFGFSVRGDSSNEVTSGYYFDFSIDGLRNANSWVCQELVFNEDQLSRLQDFSLPTDGFVGRLGHHKNIGPCIAVAEGSRLLTVKSLVRGGLWEYKKVDVEWFDGPVDLAYALGEVERLNCSNSVE